MEFFIKKNATLPVLKMQVVKDGRSDYNNFMDLIETSSIIFSMVDVETGIPKIVSKKAGFVSKIFRNVVFFDFIRLVPVNQRFFIRPRGFFLFFFNSVVFLFIASFFSYIFLKKYLVLILYLLILLINKYSIIGSFGSLKLINTFLLNRAMQIN